MCWRIFLSLLTLLLTPLTTAAEPESWPQWRGPNRDCQITPRAWPEDVSEASLTTQFRVALGDSYSGPIVIADRVFVTETVGSSEFVRALDRQTGDEVWKTEWRGSMTVPFFAAANGSWIRSTPAYSDGRLFVASMEDVLIALDAASGDEVWRKDFRKEYGTSNQAFGFACSPVVHDRFVYVQTAAGLIKIDAATGKSVWRVLSDNGGMSGGAFSSPVIAEVAGTTQLVVQTRTKLAGIQLDDGAQLWSVDVPAYRGMNILTPTILGDRIFTSSYGGGAFLFQVSRSEGGFTVDEVWKSKTEAYMSSPVVVDGKIYLHLRNQRFVCLDPENGQPLWKTTPYGKYWTHVTNGSRSLTLDERGDLLLLDLNAKEFTKIDSRHISDSPTWAHLAVADDQVFVRSLDELHVMKWTSASQP